MLGAGTEIGADMTVTTRGYIAIITVALAVAGFAGWVEGL